MGTARGTAATIMRTQMQWSLLKKLSYPSSPLVFSESTGSYLSGPDLKYNCYCCLATHGCLIKLIAVCFLGNLKKLQSWDFVLTHPADPLPVGWDTKSGKNILFNVKVIEAIFDRETVPK